MKKYYIRQINDIFSFVLNLIDGSSIIIKPGEEKLKELYLNKLKGQIYTFKDFLPKRLKAYIVMNNEIPRDLV